MIIGISGKAQSGKNTVSQMIVYTIWYYKHSQRLFPFSINHYEDCMMDYDRILFEIGWDQVPFAGKLKICLAEILGIHSDKFEDINFKNSSVRWLNMTVRELLQKFGTAIRNEVDENFWVKACLKDYEPHDIDWLIPDLRFKSEAKGIKDLEGITVRVNREGAGAGNHISEIDLDDYSFDYVINNDGNMEDLLLKVKEFCIAYNLI